MSDDFYGFGMIKAIISGVSAARAIINDLDYGKIIKPFKDELKRIHEFDILSFNTLDNKAIDFISLIHFPVFKQYILVTPYLKLLCILYWQRVTIIYGGRKTNENDSIKHLFINAKK